MKSHWIVLAAVCALALGCRTNETPEGQVDDLQITAQVKSKLASDVGLSSVSNISVNSTNGVVTLSGQVDSADAKSKAEVVAKSVPKVVRVVDNLQVATKTGAGPKQASIAQSRPGADPLHIRIHRDKRAIASM